MPENDSKLEWTLSEEELSSLSLDDESLENIDVENVLEDDGTSETIGDINLSTVSTEFEATDQWSSTIDESVFLESWDNTQLKKNVLKDGDKFWSYLRRFFISTILTLLWLLAIGFLYSFSLYIKEASKSVPNEKYASYVEKYKEKLKKVKDYVWMTNTYEAPIIWSENESQKIDEIINAKDIDYIDKKDLLSKYSSDLVRRTEDRAVYAENLKQEIVKQWFLPEELEILLSEDQAIDTIQRSLNALEVIKFSTATKVYSYMNTALTTISEMIRISWASIEELRNLFLNIGSRWEKDISSYVYMCYLNPFETNANCDNIWDLDLYYSIAKDNSINIRLFKNAMSAISQLLEKEETSLFSITFNGFNASDKSIQFNIEVYTNQEDEKALMAQWKRNPNIFILTNIVNLLKQSSFIIWANINTKEVDVKDKTINQWAFSRKVNYSTMDFEVPIQKDTEREIFDYIDLDSMKKLITERWFKEDSQFYADSQNIDNNEQNIENSENTQDLENDENFMEPDTPWNELDWTDILQSDLQEEYSETDFNNVEPENS